MKLSIILIASLLALANCQTTTTYCPSGQYSGYLSSAFKGSLSPITGLSITSSNYAPTGLYRVTASNGADQCCYNCATQTSGTCTTWTYDGCGNCYLSSATGSTNYLTPDTTGKAVCSGFSSGFVNASSSSTSTVATTTTASSSSTSQCQIGVGQNSPNAADSFTNAVSASDCCNKCGKTSGCVGFAYFGISSVLGGCWLKTYNPLAATNIQTYPGMFNGVLTSSG